MATGPGMIIVENFSAINGFRLINESGRREEKRREEEKTERDYTKRHHSTQLTDTISQVSNQISNQIYPSKFRIVSGSKEIQRLVIK